MKHLNLVVALTVCAVDAAIVCMIPLLGLLVLPCLFGGVCWATSAVCDLHADEHSTPGARRTEPQAPVFENTGALGESH